MKSLKMPKLTIRQIKNRAKKGLPIPFEVTNNLPYKDSSIPDYHFSVTINTSPLERIKLNIGDIYCNAIECKKCGSYVRSRHRHHMAWCNCKSVAVDGGSWYTRTSGLQEDIIYKTIMFTKKVGKEDAATTNNKEP